LCINVKFHANTAAKVIGARINWFRVTCKKAKKRPLSQLVLNIDTATHQPLCARGVIFLSTLVRKCWGTLRGHVAFNRLYLQTLCYQLMGILSLQLTEGNVLEQELQKQGKLFRQNATKSAGINSLGMN
jgi:hypothetical protein